MSNARLYVHATNRDSEIRVYSALRTLEEVKAEFSKHVKDFPCELPETFQTLEVRISNLDEDGEGTSERWEWGNADSLVEDFLLQGGSGTYVEVDGKILHDAWKEDDDEDEEA